MPTTIVPASVAPTAEKIDAQDLADFLKGKFGSILVRVVYDTGVKTYHKILTTLIIIGGPIPNTVAREYNPTSDPKFIFIDVKGVETDRYIPDWVKMYIKSDKHHYTSPIFPDVTDSKLYGFISVLKPYIIPTGPLRVIRIIAGIGREGTIAATRAFMDGFVSGIFKYVGTFTPDETAKQFPKNYEVVA